jgi:predicted nucleotidyltransferase
MPLFTPEEREQTAERVSRALGDDSRVEGVVVVGSLAGQADRWSDIDLEVVVADGEELAAITSDWVGYLYELLPVVHHFETAFGETLVRGFLLENLLEIDLASSGPGGSLFGARRGWCSTARAALRTPLMRSLKGSLSQRIGRSKRGSHGTTYCTPAPPCGAAAPGRDFGIWSASETAP